VRGQAARINANRKSARPAARNFCAARWLQVAGARKSFLLPRRARKFLTATAIACAAIVSGTLRLRWESNLTAISTNRKV
jgi:hypothetical protein